MVLACGNRAAAPGLRCFARPHRWLTPTVKTSFTLVLTPTVIAFPSAVREPSERGPRAVSGVDFIDVLWRFTTTDFMHTSDCNSGQENRRLELRAAGRKQTTELEHNLALQLNDASRGQTREERSVRSSWWRRGCDGLAKVAGPKAGDRRGEIRVIEHIV